MRRTRRRPAWRSTCLRLSAGGLPALRKGNDGAVFWRALQALGGKDGREAAALARHGLDVQPRIVAGQYMLADGKSQPAAAGLARTAAVDPVEAFGQAGDVFGGDAFAGVDDRKNALAALLAPGQGNLAALRRVAHGIRHQVAECAADFLQAAFQPGLAVALQTDPMPPAAQRFRFALQGLRQF